MLTEALLLDPYPFQIWIAVRGVGSGSGSGTAEDPYNATVQAFGPIAVSTITSAAGVATVTLPAGHGLAEGEFVQIAGVSVSPNANDKYYNGDFRLFTVQATSAQYYLPGTPDSASVSNAGITCTIDPAVSIT